MKRNVLTLIFTLSCVTLTVGAFQACSDNNSFSSGQEKTATAEPPSTEPLPPAAPTPPPSPTPPTSSTEYCQHFMGSISWTDTFDGVTSTCRNTEVLPDLVEYPVGDKLLIFDANAGDGAAGSRWYQCQTGKKIMFQPYPLSRCGATESGTPDYGPGSCAVTASMIPMVWTKLIGERTYTAYPKNPNRGTFYLRNGHIGWIDKDSASSCPNARVEFKCQDGKVEVQTQCFI